MSQAFAGQQRRFGRVCAVDGGMAPHYVAETDGETEYVLMEAKLTVKYIIAEDPEVKDRETGGALRRTYRYVPTPDRDMFGAQADKIHDENIYEQARMLVFFDNAREQQEQEAKEAAEKEEKRLRLARERKAQQRQAKRERENADTEVKAKKRAELGPLQATTPPPQPIGALEMAVAKNLENAVEEALHGGAAE